MAERKRDARMPSQNFLAQSIDVGKALAIVEVGKAVQSNNRNKFNLGPLLNLRVENHSKYKAGQICRDL